MIHIFVLSDCITDGKIKRLIRKECVAGKHAADTISHYYVYKISFSKTPDVTVIRIDALFMCIVVSK